MGMLQIKIILFGLLGAVALWFRGSAAKSKLETKANELKAIKKNRDVLIAAQKALLKADILTKQEVEDEIRRVKAGDRDRTGSGW